MNYTNKTIGIWGYGLVGRSVATFLHAKGARIFVFDDNPKAIIPTEYNTVTSYHDLFTKADHIIPSPGIDTRPYRHLYDHWLCELDIFQDHCTAQVIAITGSAGKTTIVHTLTHYLQSAGHTAIAAGNIGIPMLSVLSQQDLYEFIVLELSSFQLEYTQNFKPYMSIITNLHPNHLDRHGSMDKYSAAKLNIITQGTTDSITLLPYELHDHTPTTKTKNTFYFCENTTLQSHVFSLKKTNAMLDEKTVCSVDNITTPLAINKLIIASALSLLNIPIKTTIIPTLEHRLEIVATINKAIFYNDSKSTTPASTLSAIAVCNSKNILLILGGLSKGIDREELIKKIPTDVKVFCFGSEAAQLYAFCKIYNLESYRTHSLNEVFELCIKHTRPNSIVLFSPSGSSFDLFDNFAHRGNEFKKLVYQYKKTVS